MKKINTETKLNFFAQKYTSFFNIICNLNPYSIIISQCHIMERDREKERKRERERKRGKEREREKEGKGEGEGERKEEKERN